jgi:hypothetical protein
MVTPAADVACANLLLLLLLRLRLLLGGLSP